MALREFRYYFQTEDRNLSRRLHKKYGNWIVGLKAKMKGRFKEFSGDEVKGISIVNLMLCEQDPLTEGWKTEWTPLITCIEIYSHCDLNELERLPAPDGFKIIYAKYVNLAIVSQIPQIAKMPALLIGDLKTIDFEKIAQETMDEMGQFARYINSNDYIFSHVKNTI